MLASDWKRKVVAPDLIQILPPEAVASALPIVNCPSVVNVGEVEVAICIQLLTVSTAKTCEAEPFKTCIAVVEETSNSKAPLAVNPDKKLPAEE